MGTLEDELTSAGIEQKLLQDDRDNFTNTIQAMLAHTDRWCARQVEDGVSLSPERLAYRQQLRDLMTAVQASDDPYKLDLPNLPAESDATRVQERTNYDTIRQRITNNLDALKQAATALDAGTTTAAQQRAALSLAIKTSIGLSRIILQQLDTTD